LPIEIERKFLISGTDWQQAGGTHIFQGYLCYENGRTVRVRLAGDKAFLTIKGPGIGLVRPEFEYEIPVSEAEQLLDLCIGAVIEKIRHVIVHKGSKWEVDEFLGANSGLVVAEIELESEDQSFERPEWLGHEVTADHRYANASLAAHPYNTWPDRQVDHALE
jgi:adenylate cyclase